jgi:hypothetical protein
MTQLTLGENFRMRMEPKVGHYTFTLRRLAAHLSADNGALVLKALEKPCHQMAGLLEKGVSIGLASSYEAGNKRRGLISGEARKALGLLGNTAEVIKRI